jgi:hypothetical protein
MTGGPVKPPGEADDAACAVAIRRLHLVALHQSEGLEPPQGPLDGRDGSSDARSDRRVTGPGGGLVAGPEEQGGDDADIDGGEPWIAGDVVGQLCEWRGLARDARGAYHRSRRHWGEFPMSRHAPGGLVTVPGRIKKYGPGGICRTIGPFHFYRHHPRDTTPTVGTPLHPATGRVRQTPSQSVGPSVAPALLLNVRRAVHAPFDAPDGPSRPASVVTCFPPAPQVPSRHRKGRRISSLKSSFQ